MILVKSKKDYITIFNERVGERSKHPDRIGKKKGFPLGMGCVIRRDLKVKPIDDWCKEQGEFQKILGFAYDEQERLEKMHKRKNEMSFLEEGKIVESKTFDICRPYNLLSPYYDLGLNRQGCWFCPNCSEKTFACFAKQYPKLWGELELLSKDEELVSANFKYGKTFAEVNAEIKAINSRITLWDLLGERQ